MHNAHFVAHLPATDDDDSLRLLAAAHRMSTIDVQIDYHMNGLHQ